VSLAVSTVRATDALDDKRVCAAVVGLGYWGPNLVRVLFELSQVELTAVCDKSPEALEGVTRRYPGLKTTTDYAHLLHDPLIDAIVIATPVSTHYELARAALTAGKHVFVEKPLARSAQQAVELAELSIELGLTLMPGHTFLYSPAVGAVRELIASGDLGEIYFVSMSRVNLGLHQPDVSVVWDLGPHDLSILRYWLNEAPTGVAALTRGCVIPDIPDVAFINLQFRSGMIAHVELSWLAPSKLRRTTIVGSQKMVVYNDTSATEPVRVFDSSVLTVNPETFGEYQLSYRTGDILSPRIDIAEPLSLEMQDFCNAVGHGTPPRSSIQVGVDVVQVIEAIDLSLSTGGAQAPVAEAPELAGSLRERIRSL
jgi:predicted dehydrogenase